MLKVLMLRSAIIAMVWSISLGGAFARANDPTWIDVPAGDLIVALESLTKQTGVELVYQTAELKGLHTAGVTGSLTAQDAVTKLLIGTPLQLKTDSSGAMLIAVPQKPRSAKQDKDEPAQRAIEESQGQGTSSGTVKKTGWFERFRLAQIDPASPSDSSSSQDETSSQSSNKNADNKLEEIIVTATKRQMNLQDVPFGISALTSADLERSGARGAEDYLAEVPGVHYTALGRGRSPIVIRGVSTEGSSINNLQNTIETYVDDLPTLNRFSGWTNTDLNTFDIERIEVLRGPQGTLFGSGAIGGAIRVITNKPDLSRSSGKIEVGLDSTKGGDNGENVNGMVNIPIVEDRLGLRAVGYVRNDAGYVSNVRRGDTNVDGGRTEGGRLILAYAPADALNLRLSFTHEHNIVDDSPKTFPRRQGTDVYQWDGVIPERSDIRFSVFNLVGEYNFGTATLTSSTTYGTRHSFLQTDFVRLLTTIFGIPIVPTGNELWIKHDIDTFAQELRLTSSGDGPLEWTGGAFFMRQSLGVPQHNTLSNFPAVIYNDFVSVNSKEKALFGEVTYKFSSQLSVTGGLRWFDNSFAMSNGTLPGGPGLFDTPDFAPVETSTNAVTPKVSVSYHPSDRVHLYATAAKGYRIGQTNFNAGVDPAIPRGFEPDSLWNYEIGMKSRWLGNRLKSNLALFYIDWSNIQLQRLISLPDRPPINPIDNAGQAIIKGAEAEVLFRPAEGWEIGSALTYTHAKLDSVLPGVSFIPGSTLPGSPEFSASNYLQFTTQALPAHATGYVRLAHRYVGKVFGDINNSDAVASDSYNAFDVRTGVSLGRYEVALYGDNVTNNDAAVSRHFIGDVVDYAIRLRPRTIGLTFRAQF